MIERRSRRFPPPLQPGDPVGIIAPASPARTADELEAGLQRLTSRYQVERFFDADATRGYLSAPDDDRLDALNRCLAHPDLRAIFCVRGGYGSLRLLPHIGYETARHHPKLLVGYSDITALQWALFAQAGWTSLSSLVVTEWGQADASAEQHFRTWAEGNCPTSLAHLNADDALRPLSKGKTDGLLLGGNLSVVTRLLGTPYCPHLQDVILYLEDVDEAPYAIDRMLAHLQLTGTLDRLAGVVLGDFSTPDSAPDRPTLALDDVFADYFANRPYPVATGLQYGHGLPRLSMPQGTRARLTVCSDTATLTPLEPITRSPSRK